VVLPVTDEGNELEAARKRRAARGPGRPSKLTPETKQAIVKALEVGNYFTTACESAGVEPHTGHKWIKIGEGRDPDREPCEPYISFAREVRAARALAEVSAMAGITLAGQQHWQALAWKLERTAPERFALRNRSTVEVDVRGEVEHTIAPARSAAHLIELVNLAREYGIVEDVEVTEDAEVVPELEAETPEDV
jgi:transposase-like protein